MQEKSYFSWCAANIWARLNKIWQKRKKIIKHSLCSFEKKKKTTQDSFTIFPDFISILLTFLGLENGWAMQDVSKNSRLCMNPYL